MVGSNWGTKPKQAPKNYYCECLLLLTMNLYYGIQNSDFSYQIYMIYNHIMYTWHYPICSVLHCHKHRLLRNSSDNSTWSSSCSLSAPGPGLNTVSLPRNEHGSAPPSDEPIHHAPGENLWVRPKSSLSILSSTGSSFGNFRAKGALLLAILSKFFIVKDMGCCFGGLSQAM